MPIQLDSERNEPAALWEFAGSLIGQRVLEIGCGDGRLTWLYAAQTAHVTGLDPKPDDIALAMQSCPPHLRERVEFHAETILEFDPPIEKFDLALLSWSL